MFEMETLFKALADATRLRILGLLLTGEVCVCHIHESLRIPQPKASRHLAYLRRARLVAARKEGLWMHYRLARPATAFHKSLLSCLSCCFKSVPELAKDIERLGHAKGACYGSECCE